jgi:hypothetical protein
MKALALACALLFVGANVANAQFTGSAHDFSDGVTHNTDSADETVWNPTADKCNVCHEAHTRQVANPLWHRNMSISPTFVVYGEALPSKTLDAGTPDQPTGNTVLCLTCHDGTVGLDQYGWANVFGPATGGTTGYVPMHPYNGNIGGTHPVSFVYDDALALTDGFLAYPSTDVVPSGIVSFNGVATLFGTIDDALLDDGGRLECSSCHDVHNKWGLSHQLNVPYDQSAICETCHKKG